MLSCWTPLLISVSTSLTNCSNTSTNFIRFCVDLLIPLMVPSLLESFSNVCYWFYNFACWAVAIFFLIDFSCFMYSYLMCWKKCRKILWSLIISLLIMVRWMSWLGNSYWLPSLITYVISVKCREIAGA